MTVRVAFVGCGWWTTFAHIPAVLDHPDADAVGIMDANAERLASAQQSFGIAAGFTDAREMLGSVECDAVVIATPNSTHYDYARLALSMDKHALVEKPMVLRPEDGRALVQLASERGRHVVVGYATHYNAQAARLREEIRAGRIGDIEHTACLYASVVRELYRGNPQQYRDVFGYPVHGPAADSYAVPAMSGGGQGQSQLTHAAALMLWVTGLHPVRVGAFTHEADVQVDLADVVAIQFADGAVGTISSTGGVNPRHDEIIQLSVFGRRGHVLLDVTQGTASIHDDDGVETLPPLAAAQRVPPEAPVNNLIELILGHGENSSTVELGSMTAGLIEAMYRSASERRMVSLD